MSSLIRFLLIAIILYFIITWIRSMFQPKKRKFDNQPNVKIFKKGDIEKSRVHIKDAETVEYEEIENH